MCIPFCFYFFGNQIKSSSNSDSDSDSSSNPTSEEEGICLFDTDNDDDSDVSDSDETNNFLTDINDSENSHDDPSHTHQIKRKNRKATPTNESLLNNPMNYAALNFSMDMRDEDFQSETKIVQETLGRLKSLTTQEAFEAWMQDMVKQVEEYLHIMLRKSSQSSTAWNPNPFDNYPYRSSQEGYAATLQIENPLCTYRESNLSSTAWTSSFRSQLKTRPNYSVMDLESYEKDSGCVCEACGRSNHNVAFKIKFSGEPYDASRTYDIVRRTRHT